MDPSQQSDSSGFGTVMAYIVLFLIVVVLSVGYIYIKNKISKKVDKVLYKGIDKAFGSGDVTARTDAIKARKMDVAFTVQPQAVFDRIIQTLDIPRETNRLLANLHVSHYQVADDSASLGIAVGSQVGSALQMQLDVQNYGGQYVGTAHVVSLMVDEHGRAPQVDNAERVFTHIKSAVEQLGGQCNG